MTLHIKTGVQFTTIHLKPEFDLRIWKIMFFSVFKRV